MFTQVTSRKTSSLQQPQGFKFGSRNYDAGKENEPAYMFNNATTAENSFNLSNTYPRPVFGLQGGEQIVSLHEQLYLEEEHEEMINERCRDAAEKVLAGREQFAVNLRKQKKKVILDLKRENLMLRYKPARP